MHLQQAIRKRLGQIGIEDSRRNRVDLHAERAGFTRQAFGETDHRRFRSCVVDRRRQGAHRADRSDVENDSLSLPDHLFVDRFGDGKETTDVGVNHFVPGAIGRGREVVAAIDGRVVDENVDAAPLLDQFACHLLHAKTIDNRNFGAERSSSVSLNLLNRLGGEIVTGVVTESDVGTFASKHLANCRTDAARSTGYERALSFKQKTHLAMFLLKTR